MTRISSILDALDWPQHKMADYLGVRQATVSRIVNGQEEPGPQAKLLDILRSEIIDGKYGDEARNRLCEAYRPACGQPKGVPESEAAQ